MRWVVSVKGVLCRQGRVLLARNDRDEWELPGGRLEDGERPEAAVAREFAEETALAVVADALLLADTFEVVPGRSVLIVAYRCVPAGALDVRVSAEHLELRWTPLEELGRIALPGVYAEAIRRAGEVTEAPG